MSMKRINPLIALATNLLLEHYGKNQKTHQDYPELSELSPVKSICGKVGAVVMIIGRRESGKTVAAYRLAEIFGRPTYAVSPEETPPKWVTELKLEQLAQEPPPWSTLILDDIPVYASQRDYNDPFVRVIERMIPVVRHHRKLILICNTQSSSLSDRYIMDSELIFLKPANLLFLDLERPSVAKLYKQVMPIFDEMSDLKCKKHIFLFSQAWKGIAKVNMPNA